MTIDLTRYPAIWLRDNCPCVECKDPQTGQKLLGITDPPETVAVTSIEESPESVVVVYAPDGHRSTFPRAWLAGDSANDIRTEDAKQLWRAADVAGALPEETWTAYLDDPRRRAACLEAVLRLGFVLLHMQVDVQTRPG